MYFDRFEIFPNEIAIVVKAYRIDAFLFVMNVSILNEYLIFL